MRIIKFIGIVLAVVGICSVGLAQSAHGLSVQTYDQASTKKASDVIISRHSFQTDGLHYIQLFNNSSKIQSLEGWKLVYNFHFSDAPSVEKGSIEVGLRGLLEPYSYLLITGVGSDTKPYVFGSDETFDLSQDISRVAGNSLELIASNESGMMNTKLDLEKAKKTGVWRRSLSSTSNNTYTSTYKEYDATDDDYKNLVLYGHGLYSVPKDPELKVSAVLANANSCSPFDKSLGCVDYIKFYNPTSREVNLADYQLHYGHTGSDHTVDLVGKIGPEQFHVVDSSASGSSISLTNSGGFIWLSDKYNITTYPKSLFEYPSMSSKNNIGQAWAERAGGDYDWTDILTAGVNKFPKNTNTTPPDTQKPCAADQYRSTETGRCRKLATQSSNLVPCRADQYRSLETNRCRNKTSSSTSLVPCKPGQYRSVETNRCRSSTTAGASLKPCAPNQYRNPETNRCRNKSSLDPNLKPCKPGQQRSPETNRCRASSKDIPKAGYAVEPVAQGGSEFIGWWAFGGVTSLAVGYGVWEWRREIGGALAKLGRFLPWK